MEGHGAYNRSSRVQAAGIAETLPWLAEAARQLAEETTRSPLVIADYGASEGHNSLVPVGTAIDTLRARVGAEREISVAHTDVADNDFSGLFATLAGDPDSYLRRDPATFASAVGRSFYRQILPSASVALGWSSWAVQWLSVAPAPIPDHIHVGSSSDEDARATYARQAADDWRAFLAARGRELRPGGRLVVLTMGLGDDGDFGYRAVIAAMYGALVELIDEGTVGTDEARRMAIPTVGRSRDDLLAPFAGGGHAGLTVARAEVFLARDRIWEAFERDGDADAFGASWAAFSRASVFPTLALGLAGGAGDPRAPGFIERLEAGMAARLAAAPQPDRIPLARIELVRPGA